MAVLHNVEKEAPSQPSPGTAPVPSLQLVSPVRIWVAAAAGAASAADSQGIEAVTAAVLHFPVAQHRAMLG